MRIRNSKSGHNGHPNSMAAAEATAESGQGELWRNANFLKFWIGEGISLFGTQVTVIALPLTAVLTLHAGAEELGIIRFLQYFPYLIFGLPFGVIVDRSRHRLIMIVANTARLLMIGLVPVLAWLNHLNAPILLILTFSGGTAAVLFDVTWMSFVPTLVQGDQKLLVAANSRLGGTSSAADMAGPGSAAYWLRRSPRPSLWRWTPDPIWCLSLVCC